MHDETDREPLELGDVVEQMWARLRPVVLERVATLDDAVRQARAGTLGEEEHAAALVQCHRMAGSLGTYGFHDASDAARRAERVLEQDPLDVEELARAVDELRQGLAS